jgi:hypothetical protein
MRKAFRQGRSERGGCRPFIDDCPRSTSGTGTGEAGVSPLPYVRGVRGMRMELAAFGIIGEQR